METSRAAEREAKRRFWEEHLSKWKSSGISQSGYCRMPHKHQVSMPNGEVVTMHLAEMGSLVGSGKDDLWMR